MILALGSSLAAVWLYIDRDRVLEESASVRDQVAELRQVLVDTDELVADLEAGLEDQQNEVTRRGEELTRCRQALAQISAAWNDVVQAVEAAGALDGEEARALAREANEHRRAAERAARRCR